MALKQAGASAEEAAATVETLSAGAVPDTLSPADRAMLDYALKLTHTPAAMSGVDVDQLRRAGFDDRAIHDICAVTAYFAFVNRIADGLGVELEDRFGS